MNTKEENETPHGLGRELLPKRLKITYISHHVAGDKKTMLETKVLLNH